NFQDSLCESGRGIQVGSNRHNTSPNPCALRSTTVGAKRTSTGRSAPSRSVYQMGGGLTPATDTYLFPTACRGGGLPPSDKYRTGWIRRSHVCTPFLFLSRL